MVLNIDKIFENSLFSNLLETFHDIFSYFITPWQKHHSKKMHEYYLT